MKTTPRQYAYAWHAALQAAPESQWNEISERFLKYLHHSGNLKSVSFIQQLIAEIEDREHNIERVHVRMAHEIAPDMLKSILSQVLGDRAIYVDTSIDPSIIGGVQIETKDRRWDISLVGELRQLKKMLT